MLLQPVQVSCDLTTNIHTYIFLFNKLLQCSPESQKVHPVLLYLGDPENPVMQNKQKRIESERQSDHELKPRLWLEGCNQGTLLELRDFFFQII